MRRVQSRISMVATVVLLLMALETKYYVKIFRVKLPHITCVYNIKHTLILYHAFWREIVSNEKEKSTNWPHKVKVAEFKNDEYIQVEPNQQNQLFYSNIFREAVLGL